MAALTVKVMADKSVRSAEKTPMMFLASVAAVKHVSLAVVLQSALPKYVGVEITLIVCV